MKFRNITTKLFNKFKFNNHKLFNNNKHMIDNINKYSKYNIPVVNKSYCSFIIKEQIKCDYNFNGIGLVALLGLLYGMQSSNHTNSREHIIKYIKSNGTKFYNIEKHTNIDHLGGTHLSLFDIQKLKYNDFNNAIKDLKSDDQDLLRQIVIRVIYDYTDPILVFNNIKYSELFSIIFVNKTHKFVLINDTMEQQQMYNLVIDLDYE